MLDLLLVQNVSAYLFFKVIKF